jgi:hypothetical protein
LIGSLKRIKLKKNLDLSEQWCWNIYYKK